MRSLAPRLILVAFALACSAAVGRAQFPTDIHPGVRVRVSLPEPWRQATSPGKRLQLRGIVESISQDTLRLTVPGAVGTLSVASSTIRRLEISRGAPSRAATAFERAIAGAFSGAIATAAANDPYGREWPNYRRDWRAAGAGATYGAIGGAVVGFILPTERWRRVRLVP